MHIKKYAWVFCELSSTDSCCCCLCCCCCCRRWCSYCCCWVVFVCILRAFNDWPPPPGEIRTVARYPDGHRDSYSDRERESDAGQGQGYKPKPKPSWDQKDRPCMQTGPMCKKRRSRKPKTEKKSKKIIVCATMKDAACSQGEGGARAPGMS